MTNSNQSPAAAVLWLVMTAAIAGALFPLTTMLAANQDGDGIMTALISLDKLTWYFWGQDRFLNLLPALASAIPDIEANLRFQIFLRAFLAYLAPLGVLVFLSTAPRFLALATAIINAILVASLNHEALFNLYVQHNPFGTSLVLLALAWLAHARWRPTWWANPATLSVCVLAYAVNFALLIFTAPWLAWLVYSRAPQRRALLHFAALNALAVALAFGHAKIYGEPSTTFAIAIGADALMHGLLNTARHLDAFILAGVSVATLLVLRTHRMTCKADLLALVAIALCMAGLLSNLGWVQLNQFNIRYFLLSILVLATVCGTVMASALLCTNLVYPVAVAALLGSIGLGLNGFSEGYAGLVHKKWRATSVSVGELAVQEQAILIIGDFWDVWPAVYETARLRHLSGEHPVPVYGAAFRGHVLRERFLADTAGKGEQSALCFLSTTADCVQQMRRGLSLPDDIPVAARSVVTVAAGSKSLIRLQFTVNSRNL